MENEHFILASFAAGMMGLVFWMVKHMIKRIEIRCDEIDEKHDLAEDKFLKMFDKHLEERDAFLKELMTSGDHRLVCKATQAELKLHVSKVAEDNRRHFDAALKTLAASLKQNGAL